MSDVVMSSDAGGIVDFGLCGDCGDESIGDRDCGEYSFLVRGSLYNVTAEFGGMSSNGEATGETGE